MSVHKIETGLKRGLESSYRVIPREQIERDEESLRSIEISQMRILARKRPKEYLKVASEIHLDIDTAMTA